MNGGETVVWREVLRGISLLCQTAHILVVLMRILSRDLSYVLLTELNANVR